MTGGRCSWMPAAPPTKRQLITSVSMMMASAMVAIEKKMPRMRSVNRPTREAEQAPTTAAAAICTSSGAPKALVRSTAV